MSQRDISGVTGEQVAQIFETVEAHVTEQRSEQGRKRLLKIGGLVAACTSIATAASVALASFGFKVMGPPQEIAAVRSEIGAVRSSVDTLKDQVDSIIVDRMRYRYQTDAKLTEITTKQDQTQYLICVMLRRQDPTLIPKECK